VSDEATVREALRYGRPVGMGSNDEALAALARLVEARDTAQRERDKLIAKHRKDILDVQQAHLQAEEEHVATIRYERDLVLARAESAKARVERLEAALRQAHECVWMKSGEYRPCPTCLDALWAALASTATEEGEA